MKEKEKEMKKKVKHRRSSLWNKATEKIVCFFAAMSKKGEEKKKCRKSVKRPRTKQVLGMSGRLFFSKFMAQHWMCVNAAAEGLQKGTEMMERWQNQEVRVKESRWAEEISQRWKHPKIEDRTDIKKEAESVVIKECEDRTRPIYASNVTTSLWRQKGTNH